MGFINQHIPGVPPSSGGFQKWRTKQDSSRIRSKISWHPGSAHSNCRQPPYCAEPPIPRPRLGCFLILISASTGNQIPQLTSHDQKGGPHLTAKGKATGRQFSKYHLLRHHLGVTPKLTTVTCTSPIPIPNQCILMLNALQLLVGIVSTVAKFQVSR